MCCADMCCANIEWVDVSKGGGMGIKEWLTLAAVLVALFGQRIWLFVDVCIKRRQIKAIMRNNLNHLRSDLLRIRDERNHPQLLTDRIMFNTTSFSEVSGYHFLYSDVLLPNLADLKLSNCPTTIEFFNHYRINMKTIEARIEEEGHGHLTLGTVNNLLNRLDGSIKEFSRFS